VKLVAVGEAHEVAVPRGLKFQTPELDFESGWERVRATHGVSLGCDLGANYHRDCWWGADLSAVPYVARQLSVWKVVRTLTSRCAEIGLSMAGAKQQQDTRFILVSAMGHTSSRGALVAMYCKAPWCS
jgi:hypothetical protein